MKLTPHNPIDRTRHLLAVGLAALLTASVASGQTGGDDSVRRLQEENAALRKRLAELEGKAAPAPAAPQQAAPKSAAATPAPAPASASDAVTKSEDGTLVLSPFEVKGDKDYGYLKTNAATATRIGMEIQKVPMNISVVSEEFIKDTNARDLTDLFRYSAAASGDTRFAMRVPANEATPQGAFTMRGFTVNTLMRNGVFRYISHNFDNVDRVEIVKGPASVFFGQGYPGGVINFVTKRASLSPIPTTLTYTVTSESGQRAVLDQNSVLSKNAAIRVVGSWEDSQGERRYEFNKAVNISPSVTFVPFESGKVRIIAEAEYSDKRYSRNDYDWIYSDFAGWKDAALNGTYGSSTAKLSNTITATSGNGLGANVVQATTTPTLAYTTYIANKRTATNNIWLPAYTSVQRGAYYTDKNGNFIHDEAFNWTSRGAQSSEKNNTFDVTVEMSPFSWIDARYTFTHDEAKHNSVGQGGALTTPYADGIHWNIATGSLSGYWRQTNTHTADLVFKKDEFLWGNHKLLTGLSRSTWVQQYAANAGLSDINLAFLPGARNTTANPDYAGTNVAKYDYGAVPVNQLIYDRYGAIKPVRQIYSNYDPGYELNPDVNTYFKGITRNALDGYKPTLEGYYANYQGSFLNNRLTVLTGVRQEKRWERAQYQVNNYPWYIYSDDMIIHPDAYAENVWGHSKTYQRTVPLDQKGTSWMAGVSYAINDSLSVYASTSKIFKFNSGNVGGFAPGDEIYYAQGILAQYASVGQTFMYRGQAITSVDQFVNVIKGLRYYENIPNESGFNYEIGAKYTSPGSKIVGTFSIFTATRRNTKNDDTIAQLNSGEPLNYSSDPNIIAGINRALALGATTPASFNAASSSGRVFRIRNYDNEVGIGGTEVEVIYTPIRNLQAVINASWMPQAEVLDDGRPLYAEPGTAAYNALTATQQRDAYILWKSRIPNVPEYRANVFAKYTFTDNIVGEYGRGVSIGAGARYSSKTVIAQNVDWNPLGGGYQAGNYLVFDLSLGVPYELFGYKLRTTLGVYNVTDKEYSEGSFVLSPARNWTLSTAMSF